MVLILGLINYYARLFHINTILNVNQDSPLVALSNCLCGGDCFRFHCTKYMTNHQKSKRSSRLTSRIGINKLYSSVSTNLQIFFN